MFILNQASNQITCMQLQTKDSFEERKSEQKRGEMATVKCELSTRRRNSWMVDSDTTNKCVKRRRREPIASHMSSNDCYVKHVDFQQVDQSTSSTTTPKRSSRFRGVSRHKWTGRYEAHLWDKESWNVTQNKKGKQIYLGAYDEEESAARAYDLAALKYWGSTTTTNFPVSDYQTDIEIMQNLTREEYLASLRRKSNGFSRGVSKYRGVARHHHNGKWEARIGRVSGNKYLYLGTYSTQEEAARAYDIAAIEQRGIKAMTNFELSMYSRWLKPESNVLINSHIPNSSIQSYVVPETSLSHIGTFTIDYLGSPQRQEALPREFVSNRPSLPSALSLLLRSSIFNDMVKKNPSSSEDEFDGDYRRQRSRSGTDDESDEIFYNQVEDIPYASYDSNASLNFGVEENMSLSSFYSSLLKLVS